VSSIKTGGQSHEWRAVARRQAFPNLGMTYANVRINARFASWPAPSGAKAFFGLGTFGESATKAKRKNGMAANRERRPFVGIVLPQ